MPTWFVIYDQRYENEISIKGKLLNNKRSIPEFSSDLRTSDLVKVYPIKLVSFDVSICKLNIQNVTKKNTI